MACGASATGAVCEELYLHSLGMAEAAGLGVHYMGYPGEQARFVGHGVGLELDEFPVLAKGFRSPLQEGQTLALEPKFIFPGKGVVVSRIPGWSCRMAARN